MDIDATLIGQMLTFLVLVFFTAKFVWPPIMKAMEERQVKIADGLAAAEKSQRELLEAQKKITSELQAAKKQAAEFLEAAERRSKQAMDEAKAQAQQEAVRLREQAHVEITQAVAQARQKLQEEAVELAVSISSRFLKEHIDEKAHRAFLEDVLSKHH